MSFDTSFYIIIKYLVSQNYNKTSMKSVILIP